MSDSTPVHKRSSRDPGLLRERLARWLSGRIDAPEITALASPQASGMSSETLVFDVRFRDAGAPRTGSFVARLAPDPRDVPVFPVYDLETQFRVLRLVAEKSRVPVPRVRWLEPDPSLSNVVGYQTVQSSNKTTMTHDVICGRGQEDGWTFNGTIGNNGIFISPVNVTCSYNHSIIAEIYYRYSGSGGWVLYTEPFTIFSQGIILFYWYWVDYDGIVHDTLPITFSIDYTPPSLDVSTRRIGVLTWRITATVSDNLGIDYVEFYFDDVLQVTVENPPYVWTWTFGLGALAGRSHPRPGTRRRTCAGVGHGGPEVPE